jgi:hypothetical protein
VRTIYVDPSYKVYYQDRLFDESDRVLNRDDSLAPHIRLRTVLKQRGADVHTADFLMTNKSAELEADYYSFGVLENYHAVSMRPNIRLRAFIIFEPPVVAPHLYQALPELTKLFDRVYIHNINGDGYSLKGVDASRLYKFYWPQPRAEVIKACWNMQNRQRRIVVINGNHKPRSANDELYSKRIEAIVSLARLGAVDLYGRGWDKWWSRSSTWLPYWRNRSKLISVYKGSCDSKYEVMKNYAFALCFENMKMKGYVTEKIFDCFYSGTIPLYWGATDITDLIPREAYIDVRQFNTWQQMYAALMSVSENEIESMREAGREFLRSEQGLKFYHGLLPIFEV